MSLVNIEKTITLDVYDYDTTPSVVKAIQLDKGTRTVYAGIQNSRQDYDIGQNATVSLTVLRPDKTKVQIIGETFVSYTGAEGTMYGAKAELSDVALAVKGNLKAQFKITSGEQELRTEVFTISTGEALDAYDGDWAGDLDGHNLDEMAQDIEDTKAAVSEMETDVSELKEGLNAIDERVLGLEAGGSGGLSMTAVNLLTTILNEAVYGTDQTTNIELLYKELAKVRPVSITAELTSRALVGLAYSALEFEITATFDDESTITTDEGYRVLTSGNVVSGSNTVTVSFRGVTTTVTFTAEQVTTYTVTYNLTDVTSSNMTALVVEDDYYSTTLSVGEDYGFNGCTVTMGGVDITSTAYSNMEILITEVTGNVVITASATEIVPITDTTNTHINTRVISYSDNGQTILNSNYSESELYYTKHNFASASTVTVTIANNTESDITAKVYAGEIPANVNALTGISGQRKPNLTNVELWNAVKVTPSSNVISAGGSISADIDITAGRRIAVSLPNGMTSLDITIVGAYNPIDYSVDYDQLTLTAVDGATTTGRTYYIDDGTTIVGNNGSDAWGYEFYNNSYQWDTSKVYHIVERYEPQDNTVKYSNCFVAGFGTEVRTKTVYNCNSLCDVDHWDGNKGYMLPYFDYIGTIQPLSGYPVYTTFYHNDNCNVYVKEVSA